MALYSLVVLMCSHPCSCVCVEDGGVLPVSKLNGSVHLSHVCTAIGSVVQSNHIAARQLIQLCTQVHPQHVLKIYLSICYTQLKRFLTRKLCYSKDDRAMRAI